MRVMTVLEPKEREKGHVKRLNHILPEKLYNQMVELSEETRLDLTDITRLGLGLALLFIKETQKGNKIVVTDQEGIALKELVLPAGL
jgi:hypothetical protein